MGKLEVKDKIRSKRENLQKTILYSVAAAGLLSAALVAPNVMSALSKLGIVPRPRQKEYVASSASKLAKRGLLKFQSGHYELTLAGQKLLRRWELQDYKLQKPRKWDKKWRMIIFDIPEKKRKIRMRVTNLFRQSGLYRLQDSVWIFPYDCEDLIALLKTDFGIGKDVLYVIATEIENDKHLRSEFNLN